MVILLFIIFKKIGLDFLSFTFYLLFLLIHIIG
ncbi:putative membrane protein, partial [Acinetobacter baumannii 26016_7]